MKSISISYIVFDDENTGLKLILYGNFLNRIKNAFVFTSMTNKFSFIPKLETALSKKLFNVSTTISSF